MKYSLPWLLETDGKEVRNEFIFFWGHRQYKEGVIDKSCFSQWYPAGFVLDGASYKTAEHWMMAKKALLFEDQETFQKILLADDPSVVKTLGREVKNFNPEAWDKMAYAVVLEGNRYKFSQNVQLKKFILDTGEKILVEASPLDKVWGIGLSQDAKEAADPKSWRGSNLLGFALMEVRDLLIEQNEK